MTPETGVLTVEIGKPIVIERARVFVNPPTVHVGTGAAQIREVQLLNKTGADVQVWFPHGAKLFDERTSVRSFAEPFLIAVGASRSLYVKEVPQEGQYSYHVYCEAIEDYAEGNSPPIASCP